MDKQPFCCRDASGSLRPLVIGGQCYTRRELYCVHCAYTYGQSPCPFRPNPKQEPPSQPKASGIANLLGTDRYSDDELLEILIGFHERNGRWPRNTTEYRDDPRLPHSRTIVKHFGSLERAHQLARERMGPRNCVTCQS